MLQQLHRLLFSIALAPLCLAASGCGDGRPARVPVSGQVLIDGKPLAHGFVRLVPADGRPSSGALDQQGRFTLSCFEKGDGALIGTHQVEVGGQQTLDERSIKWHAPKEYAAASTSGLTQTIDGPSDSVVINLTWGGKPGPFVEIIE